MFLSFHVFAVAFLPSGLCQQSSSFRLLISSPSTFTARWLHLAKSTRLGFFLVSVCFRVHVHKCVGESVLGQAPVSK